MCFFLLIDRWPFSKGVNWTHFGGNGSIFFGLVILGNTIGWIVESHVGKGTRDLHILIQSGFDWTCSWSFQSDLHIYCLAVVQMVVSEKFLRTWNNCRHLGFLQHRQACQSLHSHSFVTYSKVLTNMRYPFTYVFQYPENHYSSPIKQNKKCYGSIHFIENGGFQLVELWDWERAQNLEEIPIILSF